MTTTPKPTLDERRDVLSKRFINELFGDCDYCDLNQSSFIRGWDAAIAEMQSENENLKNLVRLESKRAQESIERNLKKDEQITEMQAEIERLKKFIKEHSINDARDATEHWKKINQENQKLREALEVALAYCSLEATWRPVLEKALEGK